MLYYLIYVVLLPIQFTIVHIHYRCSALHNDQSSSSLGSFNKPYMFLSLSAVDIDIVGHFLSLKSISATLALRTDCTDGGSHALDREVQDA